MSTLNNILEYQNKIQPQWHFSHLSNNESGIGPNLAQTKTKLKLPMRLILGQRPQAER